MPRDVDGTYTLPLPPVANGAPNVVSSTWMNTTLADIANALTDSVSLPGSVTPNLLNNDQAGFQAKMGLDVIVNELEPRLAFLESCADDEIGDIDPFPFGTVPDNYLECAGQAVSRTTYAELFSVIGTTWGDGDGSTTFNLPDFRAEWITGSSDNRNVATWEDGQVGTHTHTASSATAGAHTHTGNTASSGAHTHTGSTAEAGGHTHTVSGTTAAGDAHTHSWSATTSSAGGHTHTTSFSRTPGKAGIGKNVIKGSGGTKYTTASAGAHSHSVSGTTGGQSANHTHTISGTTGSSGSHSHTVTVSDNAAHSHSFTTSTDGAHSHTVTVDSTGGEARMRNVAVMYCIRYRRGE